MNKKIIAWCSFGLIASLTSAFASFEEGNFYVAARGGAMWIDSISVAGGKFTPDAGYSVTGAVGYEMPLPDLGNPDHPIRLRLEIESGYANSSTTVNGTSVNIDFVPVMANAIIDYYITQNIYVYAGIGGGLSIQNASALGYSENHNNYAVQARGGAGYKITETISLEAGYRIFSQKFQSPVAQMFEAGIVMRF